MQVSQLLHARGYRLGPRIGKGSYAKVKTVERIADNRIMAAKIVTRKRVAKEFLHKFLPRELSVVLCLSHRNLVQVYEIVQTDEVVCLMMELAERGDLLDFIKRRSALKEDDAGLIFAQVCNGVSFLHDQCICHRDLKCENVLLRKDMSVALSDFGFSKFLSRKDTLSSTYCGSAAYASPDLLRGTPYKPLENDIWSLGCILFIMVTGQMPFYDKNTKKMMYRQLKGKVNFPEHKSVSQPCKHLISCILQPNINLRYDIHAILAHQWLQPYVELVNQGVYKSDALQRLNPHNSCSANYSKQNISDPISPSKIETVSAACKTSAMEIGKPQVGITTQSDNSVGSADSDEPTSTAASDTASLCRMPGEACIIHHAGSAHLDTGAGRFSRTADTIRNVSLANPSTHSQVSSLSLDKNTPHHATRTSATYKRTSRSNGSSSGGSAQRYRERSPDENFKMAIQKILQIPVNKKSHVKGGQDQPATTSSNNVGFGMGTSQAESDESSRSDLTSLSQPNTFPYTSSQLPANHPTQQAYTSLRTSNNNEVTVEKTRLYQEGLVKQMRRIFESKDASTGTNSRPRLGKRHG